MSRDTLQVLELSGVEIVQAPLGFKDYGLKGMEQQEKLWLLQMILDAYCYLLIVYFLGGGVKCKRGIQRKTRNSLPIESICYVTQTGVGLPQTL